MDQFGIIVSLLNQVAEGKIDAFSRFYDIYYPKAYKFSRYFIKSEEGCQEIVSDLFYTLWKRRKTLADIENIDSYIYTSIKNLSFKYKKEISHNLSDPLEVLPGEFFIETDTPENVYLNNELVAILEKTINELPDRCKLIFLMAKEQGLKHKEIAEILSISEHTVHAQMTIASKKISTILKDYNL